MNGRELYWWASGICHGFAVAYMVATNRGIDGRTMDIAVYAVIALGSILAARAVINFATRGRST